MIEVRIEFSNCNHLFNSLQILLNLLYFPGITQGQHKDNKIPVYPLHSDHGITWGILSAGFQPFYITVPRVNVSERSTLWTR